MTKTNTIWYNNQILFTNRESPAKYCMGLLSFLDFHGKPQNQLSNLPKLCIEAKQRLEYKKHTTHKQKYTG